MKKGKMTGEQIIAFRKKHDMSRSDLASLLGVTEHSIWRYEKNDVKIQELMEQKMLTLDIKKK